MEKIFIRFGLLQGFLQQLNHKKRYRIFNNIAQNIFIETTPFYLFYALQIF